jgi:hypothetical protein
MSALRCDMRRRKRRKSCRIGFASRSLVAERKGKERKCYLPATENFIRQPASQLDIPWLKPVEGFQRVYE